jgi:hypothetical protein
LARVPILIGYSLDDPDMRSVLADLRNRLGRSASPVWALVLGASPSEQQRFERRGVHVVPIPLGRRSHSDVLTQLFGELRDHWVSNVLRTAEPSGRRPRIQSKVAVSSRTCLFLVPDRLLAYYKDAVFPIVESFGLTPLSPDEITERNGPSQATTEALIERAGAVVVDVGDGTELFELSLVTTKHPDRWRVAVVTEDESPILERSMEFQTVVRRLRDPASEPDSLAEQLVSWLADISGMIEVFLAQARSLLELSEPGAAIVVAYTELERALRRREGGEIQRSARTPTMVGMLDELYHQEVIDRAELQSLRDGWRTRSQFVHGFDSPTQGEASSIVSLVERLVTLLRNR